LTTRHAWNDNNFEGKLLRKAISKLAKRLKDEEDMPTEELVKLINCIATAANVKKGLAQYEHLDKKVSVLLDLLKSRELKIINNEAKDDNRELPRPTD